MAFIKQWCSNSGSNGALVSMRTTIEIEECTSLILECKEMQTDERAKSCKTKTRVTSLDVFRGLSIVLMILVDYGGTLLPIIAHSPWNGLHLADFVMPFFLFIAGVSLALVYKNVPNKRDASLKALLKALKLFILGIILQGGYIHGLNSLTYGIDVEKVRWLGILQRIAIGYIVAALCQIWLSHRNNREIGTIRCYFWHWCMAFILCAIYLALSYGLYVPDWHFEVSHPTTFANQSHVYTVRCSKRGDLGPACNSAGMIDRHILGINHLYSKPVYRNLKECKLEESPTWCNAPFDPEGLLSSLTSAVTCIIGLHYGHILANYNEHKKRISHWLFFSLSLLLLGVLGAFLGMPVNKSLYSISYMMITSATAGVTFCGLYILVDVHEYRRLTCVLRWMGIHSLAIFVVITSNVAIAAIQGFYWRDPQNNLIHCLLSLFRVS